MTDFLLMLNHLFFFIILFGALVFVHEFGHFIVAKFFDVKVEKFSLGFGHKLIGKKWGETEYCISWFPLGGFVQLLGQEPDDEIPEEDAPRAYRNKEPWKRLLIVLAGPAFNLIFPIFIFAGMYMHGVPVETSRIGHVFVGSVAESAGLKSGDRVIAVNGRRVCKWRELQRIIGENPGRKLVLTVERGGREIDVEVVPSPEPGRDVYGEKKTVGAIGIMSIPMLAAVGVDGRDTPAYRAGFRTGMVVKKINGRDVLDFRDMVEKLSSLGVGDTAVFSISHGDGDSESSGAEVEIKVPVSSLMYRGRIDLVHFGLYPAELFVRDVVKGSAAAKAGIKPGDRIVAFGGERVRDWEHLRRLVERSKGKRISLTVSRDGREMTFHLSAAVTSESDALTGRKEKHWRLGIVSWAVFGEPETYTERISNPFSAAWKGVRLTGRNIGMFCIGLYKLFTGRLSSDSVGGPILIAKLAGSSYRYGGWLGFLRILIMLSITLGVINLLPIPVLDGGHIIFNAVEWVSGRPVPRRVQEIGTQIGLAIIIALMAFAFYNDLTRLM